MEKKITNTNLFSIFIYADKDDPFIISILNRFKELEINYSFISNPESLLINLTPYDILLIDYRFLVKQSYQPTILNSFNVNNVYLTIDNDDVLKEIKNLNYTYILFKHNNYSEFMIDMFIRNINKHIAFVKNEKDKLEIQRIIENSKREWESTLDSISDMIIITDTEGRIIRCNQVFIRKLGFKYSDVIGNLINKFLKIPLNLGFIKTNIKIDEIKFDQLEGWYTISVFPVSIEGKIQRLGIIISDITKQKIAEMELEAEKENLELKVKERTKELEEINKSLKDEITEREELTKVLQTAINKYEQINNELIEKNNRMKNELEIAKKFQSLILPPIEYKDENLLSYCSYIPAEELAGDFFDYFKLDNDQYVYLIADVSGHGVTSSFITFIAKLLINDYINKYKDLEITFNELNQKLENFLQNTNYYLTVFCLILDLKERIIKYINAGHTKSILYSSNNSYSLLPDNGKKDKFIGIWKNYKYKMYIKEISKGDKLILYTDGLTEARNINGDFYTEERVISHLKRNNNLNINEIISNIKDDYLEFTKGSKFLDDMTIVGIEIL